MPLPVGGAILSKKCGQTAHVVAPALGVDGYLGLSVDEGYFRLRMLRTTQKDLSLDGIARRSDDIIAKDVAPLRVGMMIGRHDVAALLAHNK